MNKNSDNSTKNSVLSRKDIPQNHHDLHEKENQETKTV